MPEESLTLTHANIGELEAGGIGYAIDRALEEALADCARRPTLKKDRMVTIVIKVSPIADSLDQGPAGLKTVGIQAAVKLSTPPRAGNGEFLNVATGINAAGEVVTQASFVQVPLLRAGSN